jgi:hypothetical protein
MLRGSVRGRSVRGVRGVHARDSGSGAKWGRSGFGCLCPCLAATDAARLIDITRLDNPDVRRPYNRGATVPATRPVSNTADGKFIPAPFSVSVSTGFAPKFVIILYQCPPLSTIQVSSYSHNVFS